MIGLRICLAIVFSIACLCIPKFYQQVARPFAPWRNQTDATVNWKKTPTPEEKRHLDTILAQRFFYLGKGVQAFAFLSEDGAYVVKIPFFDHCRFPYGRSLLRKGKKWLKLPLKPEKKMQPVLESYKIAFEHLQEETQLIWCHLQPGQSDLPSFQVVDRRGICHSIDPRIHTFAIQKKALPFFQELERAKIEDPLLFDLLVQSYVDLLDRMDAKKCYFADRKGKSNFGVCEGKAVQIDLGSFEISTKTQKEFFVSKLKGWMQKRAPDKIERNDCLACP